MWFIGFFYQTLLWYSYYSLYYWTDINEAKKTFKSDIVILQDYNIHLYEKYKWKKICYLTVWEFDGDKKELEQLWLTWSVIWFNERWNSYLMNMGSSQRLQFLLNEANRLKNIWCQGLFLDTIWQDWQEKESVEVVKNIYHFWKDGLIIPNNAHNFKQHINDYVYAYFFENFWDYGTQIGTHTADWYINLFEEYSKTWKRLLGVNYKNPKKIIWKDEKQWFQQIKKYAKKYSFEIQFSDLHLEYIYHRIK